VVQLWFNSSFVN